jgi:uncharacterized protein YggE
MTLSRAAAVALALVLPGSALAQQPPAAAPRVIRVSGEARVRLPPDVALLFAGVESTGKDLARVTKEAAEQMRRVLAAVADAGVAEKDVQTTRHDVRVERPWENGRPGPITGFMVSDEARVTVRDLSRLGSVLERVTAAGSNSLRGLSFQKEDPTPERARALAQAYGSALLKAEALARAAGVELGPLVSVSETVEGSAVPMLRTARIEGQGGGTPISPGEVEIGGTVEVTFAIH